jgi:hypothetical protein
MIALALFGHKLNEHVLLYTASNLAQVSHAF